MDGLALRCPQGFEGLYGVVRRQMDRRHEVLRKVGTDGKKSKDQRAEAVPYFREKTCPARISGQIDGRSVRSTQEKASLQEPVGVPVGWAAAAVMHGGSERNGYFVLLYSRIPGVKNRRKHDLEMTRNTPSYTFSVTDK